MRRLHQNIIIAFQSLFLNKTRSFLTMLGIIIGVGAVVAMLSIGTGAQQSVLSSVQDIGSNLIIISPGNPEEEEQMMGPQMMFAGDTAELGIDDVRAIKRESTLTTEVAPVIMSISIVTATVVCSVMLKKLPRYAESIIRSIIGIKNIRLYTTRFFRDISLVPYPEVCLDTDLFFSILVIF